MAIKFKIREATPIMILPAVTTFLGIKVVDGTVYIGTLEDESHPDAEYSSILASPGTVVVLPEGRTVKELGLINLNGNIKYVWVVYPE